MSANAAQRFSTRWQAAVASGANDVQREIFTFAKIKLLGLLDADDPCLSSEQKSTKPDGELAALGTRLMLEFEPLRESADQEARLVEGHMRIAYSVPKHRHYLRGGTPSEPVLAEAAACIMDNMSHTLLATLEGYLKIGLISKGERGELVSRLLLTLAHDKCVTFDPDKAHEAQFSKPIPVVHFLEALVGRRHMEAILDSKLNNVDNNITFREAFKDAKLNFTHFVRGGDASVITDKAAWMALSRCMAFQCANGQWMIDLYIPILLWDEKLSRYVVSGIFIQIKNRLKKQPVEIDATKLGFFSDSPDGNPHSVRYNERPYITIVMHLGIQPGSPDVIIASAPVRQQPVRRVKKTDKNIHPRYAINITGCENAVYDVIKKEDDHKYAALLTSRDVLGEHPRQGDNFIRAVLRLKPYWTELARSFHWATTDEDEHEHEHEHEREPFVVGLSIDPPLKPLEDTKGKGRDFMEDKTDDFNKDQDSDSMDVA